MPERSFFNLQGDYITIRSANDFWQINKNKDEISDILYEPSELIAGAGPNSVFKFERITFKNVSFSLTDIRGFEFKNCKFEKCQFFRTKFNELEFHDCEFIDCNMAKCIFTDTYITPKAFDKCLDPKEHQNIGVHLYQQLMKNSKNADQPVFSKLADFEFMKWKRYQLKYEISIGKVNCFKGCWDVFVNWLYQWILGYGIRLRHFIISALSVFFIFWILNRYNLEAFGLNECSEAGEDPWLFSLYYTTISLSNLGYGDLVPSKITGKMWASGQAVVGAILFAILASVIFKKFSR